MNNKPKPNYATLIKGNKKYPVTYTIKQDGTKVFKKGFLKGKDLTENQINELLLNSKTKIVTHGGARKGAGAKKKKASEKKEPTKVMRVPVSKVNEVKTLIK